MRGRCPRTDEIGEKGKGSVLALQYWKDYEFVCIKFKEVDGVKIKENTYYELDAAGRFVKSKE